MSQKRILTGDRPTGRMHLGHYVGSIEQIIYEGTLRTNEEAEETLTLMKKAMGLTGTWNKISRKGRQRLEQMERQVAATVGS